VDFSWTQEQLNARDAARRFAHSELGDPAEEFSPRGWQACARFGVLGLPFPKEYGGAGEDIFTTILTMEGLGAGCRNAGLLFALNAQMWAVQHPLLAFGTPSQKEKYLPKLISGEIAGAHAMTEPESGSDAYGLQTTAERNSGGYVLNGVKKFITNGPVADVSVVFATINANRGIWGVTAFLVDRDSPGYHASPPVRKMGLSGAAMGEIHLENCLVPIENRLGGEGGGARVFESSMEWERSSILACQLGAMQRQLDECIGRARERRQFGQPIGKFQVVANRIVEMKVRLEAVRLLLYQTAWKKHNGMNIVMDAAIVKLYLSEAFVDSGLDAIRTFGGDGYLTESGVEQDLRDAIGGLLYSGTSDILRNVIAHQLGLG
jgi:alkylation response protein AidB-like acyl-CoA dehydrogenase